MYDWISIKVGGVDAAGFASNDFDALETTHTHDGRFPRYDNEIAIPRFFAAQLGKEIGDGVEARANGITRELIITGYFSTTNNHGHVAAVTEEGYRAFRPDYRRKSINVYFNKGVSYDDFYEKLKQGFGVLNIYRQSESGKFARAKSRAEEKISAYMERYGINSVEYAVIYNGEIILSGSSGVYQIEKITNFNELIKAQIGIYSRTMALVTGFISAVSLVIISLIMSMTVRSIVARRRRELGTMKACGFTTRQLARQLAISFIPAALIGVTIGCTAGALAVNPAMTAMMSAQGVYNAELDVSALTVIAAGVVIGAATCGIANMAAMSIKHISAYELLSE
jgi:ABC-type antimicrobial peptide transport system permease subunit